MLTCAMSEDRLTDFLEAVDDADCRALLRASRGDAKTVKELSEECDVPLSTAYRKVGRLHEAGLVEEKIRFDGSGTHTRVYEQQFDCAVIVLTDDGGLDVELARSESGEQSTDTDAIATTSQ